MSPSVYIRKSQPLATQNMTVFGDRIFKEIMKIDEVVRVGPNPRGLEFLQEEEGTLGMGVPEESPREHTGRRQPSVSQAERPLQEPTLMAP